MEEEKDGTNSMTTNSGASLRPRSISRKSRNRTQTGQKTPAPAPAKTPAPVSARPLASLSKPTAKVLRVPAMVKASASTNKPERMMMARTTSVTASMASPTAHLTASQAATATQSMSRLEPIASLTKALMAFPKAQMTASPTPTVTEMAKLPFHADMETEMATEIPRKAHLLMNDWAEEVPDYLSTNGKAKQLLRIPVVEKCTYIRLFQARCRHISSQNTLKQAETGF